MLPVSKRILYHLHKVALALSSAVLQLVVPDKMSDEVAAQFWVSEISSTCFQMLHHY